MITIKCWERALLISKRMFFVFELQHPIDPLWRTLSGRVTDLGIIYGSFLTFTFPWEIDCQICTRRIDKSKMTAIIRVERLADLNFICFYPTKTYIIISDNWGEAASPVGRSLLSGMFWDTVHICHYWSINNLLKPDTGIFYR